MNLIFLVIFTFFSCNTDSNRLNGNSQNSSNEITFEYINPHGMTIESRFPSPPDFERMNYDSTQFAGWLRKQKLKPHDSPVYLYNGQLKNTQEVHCAVLDIDVGKQDLQQCADAVMRLRAEYLYQTGQSDKISFHFTNGFEVPWSKFTQGYRVAVNGNKTSWVHKTKSGAGYKELRQYLNLIFSYAGSLSLSKEMKKQEIANIEPGNVFIYGGSPGHAVIVMDVIINKSTQEKMFILAQSYMPAQEIHVLKNPANYNINPWYSAKDLTQLLTPEWSFQVSDLKKF